MKIIIYQSNIIKIGGVETFTYNMCKRLSKHYDVLLLYKNCAIEQLFRINKYVNVEKYDDKKQYECDICILASSWGGYPDSVTASSGRYIQMIHANYKELLKTGYRYTKWKKTTEHIAVSNTVRDIFNELYNENSKTIYNILDDTQPTNKILKLISCTRLSGEKGYNRMLLLMNKLKEHNIKFQWLIFTDLDTYKIKPVLMQEVIFMKPTYDIWDYIKDADYGVQLSDTEGYSYFVNECLQYGTPMITTNFDSAFESVIDGYNGYILDMELSNLDIDKIVNHIPNNFEYKEKTNENTWIKYLGKPDGIITTPINSSTKTVISNNKYYDTVLQREIKKGEIVDMTIDRANQLIHLNYVRPV